MIEMLPIFGWNLLAVFIMMSGGWIVSLICRNVTIVDSLWGFGFVVIVWLTAFLPEGGYAPRSLLLAALTTCWGLRLCVYLSWRNWGSGEDPRYAEWRRRSGSNFWLTSLVKVFWLQAVFQWTISLVLQVGQLSAAPARMTWLDGLGLLIWGVGFFFESVGDWQLARFKANPANRGRVMNRGLWAYTRHPNYFGEFLIWWGFYFITLSVPGSWWTVVCPVIVTTVLLKMTGIPLTEKSIIERRPAYREYIASTSAFFPWPPKRKGLK
jgi:steroid 5-alpha reductase family enzyme